MVYWFESGFFADLHQYFIGAVNHFGRRCRKLIKGKQMNSGICILRVLLPLTDWKRRFTASTVRVVRFSEAAHIAHGSFFKEGFV